MSYNVQGEHFIFRKIYVYTYVHVTKPNEKDTINFKENKEYMRGFEQKKGKGK